MLRFIDKLLSPNFWVLVATLLGIGGLVCTVTGFFTERQALMHIGMYLLAPLIMGGIVLLVIVIPVLIVASRKHK